MEATERFELRLDKATLKQIDRWRSEQDGVPPRAEAVRSLLKLALGPAIESLRSTRISIEKALGLIRSLSDNPATENARCSGRTARLILRGLVALSAGKNVLVVGLNDQQALSLKLDLERHARKWKIPFDGDGYGKPDPLPYVRAFTPDSERTGLRGVTLVDHSVIERMEAAAGVEAGGEVPMEVF